MQDQYVGDIGDYAKYSLLGALSHDRRLGVSWYLFPDEGTNDGKHTKYLCDPGKWQQFDKRTFDFLSDVVNLGKRRVSEIERSGLFPGNTVFWNRKLDFHGCKRSSQGKWRDEWFRQSLECLKDCDLVFADPDNGLLKSEMFRPGRRKHAKSISECEARTLADRERPVVIYHHNTRFKGGHDAEVRHWLKRMGGRTCAVRWRHVSARTFFICNCTRVLEERATAWCEEWKSPKVFFVNPSCGTGL